MNNSKWCGAGQHFVNVNDFHKRGKGLQPNCAECQNKLNRERYKNNKKTHIVQVRENNKRRVQAWQEWKKTLVCQMCSESYWRCLDFHHLDPSQKDITIGDAFGRYGYTRLMKELNKCVVLCKNCHTKVHGGVLKLPDDIPTVNGPQALR